MIASPISGTLRFRRDLTSQCLEMGPRSVWVLRDPSCRDIQYVNEEEYAILRLADGTRTVQEIYDQCSRQFASRFISPEALVRFLAEAKRRRLVIGTGIDQSATAPANSNRSDPPAMHRPRWQCLLAVRFPGIQPDRCLDFFYPAIRWLFSATAMAVYWLLVITAAAIAVVNWAEIGNSIAAAFASRGLHTLIQLVVVISLVKIIHELAHAATCKAFGANCRELGVMLLLGVPCLYCDVSDAWLIPQRFKRVLVSAAGMIAELGIAALATLLWMGTGDVAMREWCLVVMVVCSVSTVIVNGNPLMRYDGYFILSDLVGIPNLAATASASFRRLGRWLIWSEPPSSPHGSYERHRWWLAGYAVLSGCYRIAVLAAFAIGIYRFTWESGLAILGMVLAGALSMAIIAPAAQALLKPPRQAFGSQPPAKRIVKPVVIGMATIGMLGIPLPRSVVAPMTIRPADSQEIYLPVGGRLLESVGQQTRVHAGAMIARFDNPTLYSEWLRAEARYQDLQTEQSNLAKRRTSEPDLANRIAATLSAKQAASERIRLLREEIDQLTLSTPRDGMVFAPVTRASSPSGDSEQSFWTMTPLDPINHGAWFEPGTLICIVGDPLRREAILMVEQKSVSLIKLGQRAELLASGGIGETWSGEVIEIGVAPVIDCPVELTASGLIPIAVSSNVGFAKMPRDTLYQVRVRLSNPTDAVDALRTLPIRTTGYARIAVDAESLWSRAGQLLFQSIRI